MAATTSVAPQTVTLLDAQHRNDYPFSWLGPVLLIRLLTNAAIVFLIAVIATSMSPGVSSADIGRGFPDSGGAPPLWNTLFLLFCVGLGAPLTTLFQTHRYVAASIYDPKYDAPYYTRLILGVIAGLTLVEMPPAQMFDRGNIHSFGKPALATFGGFSVTAVHRLLQWLADTLEALVCGDRLADIGATMWAYRARVASEHTQWQSELVANLTELQQSFDGTASPEAMRKRPAGFTRAMLAVSDPAATPPPSLSVDGPSEE